jgi:phosphatidylglycerophosphate synthase
MFGLAARIYRETRKKHDQIFNVYVMRPLAAGVVAAISPTGVTPNQVTLGNLVIFAVAAWLFAAWPSWAGGLVAVGVLETSYCLDCVDGMLARFKNLASTTGHLFDFFTDEVKAILLVSALAVRAWRRGGLGVNLHGWSAGDPRFLLAGIGGVVVVACALSLTNFVRRPEISGRSTTVEAFYETVGAVGSRPKMSVSASLTTLLRWLNHYPSHIWLWAALDRLDVYLWVYVAINAAYLASGWLKLAVRLGGRGPR